MDQKGIIPSRLVWIDLEMTGLNYQHDVILEIATIITDIDLNIVECGPNLAIYQPDEVLARMDNWCQETHAQSGLIDRVRESQVTMQQAEEETLYFIQRHCAKGISPLCGNSIWFDKLFLKKDMPRIIDYLHYRTIDVTTFKVMLAAWTQKPNAGFKKKNNHRALDDIKESIEELKFYRQQFMTV